MMQLGLHAIVDARPVALTRYLIASLGLGTGFVVLLVSGFIHMRHLGLALGGSLYAASFFGLTVLHAAHVLVGLGGVASLVPRARRGAFSTREHTAVRNWTSYWHFITVVWLAVFTAVYLW